MAAKFAWILNLDADVELAAIASAAAGACAGYTPKRSVASAMRAFVPQLAANLLDPEIDMLIDEDAAAGSARGLVGRAFCPTPRALRMLERAGAEPEPHPECDVLVKANSRAFCSALGTTLPGAAFFDQEPDALALLRTLPPPELATAWRVKRNFGMTGRGQCTVTPAALSDSDRAFVSGGMTEGGVQIEPNVTIATEFSIHGFLEADGALELGPVVEQRCDARGAWVSSTKLAAPNEGDLQETLGAEARRVGSSLSAIGYFGPFGVDAYTYRARSASDPATFTIALQIRSEINARFTMGFALSKLSARGR